ncbi:MAG: T9SS type A sorting domain-containing protein [Saprospiraceae bacterium]|nr:T9SS type A sorting domain-containing protein [Saprospiraceae bacterium]
MYRIVIISAIYLLLMGKTTLLIGQLGTVKPTFFTWEGATSGNRAVWKVDDTHNVYRDLDGVDVTIQLLDPLNLNTTTKNPSEFNDFTKSNTFFNRGNLAFQITSSQKAQTACMEFAFSKPVFLNQYQIWDIDMLQSSPHNVSTYQDSVSFMATNKAGNVALSLAPLDENPTFTITKQSAKANFRAGVNGDVQHNDKKGAIAISSDIPIEKFTLCYANASDDDGSSNSHAVKIPEFSFTELLGGISGQVIDDNTGLPLAGSVVRLLDQNGEYVLNKFGWFMQTMTDESGLYSFDHLTMGTYTIFQINPPGFDSIKDLDDVNDNKITAELDVISPFSNGNNFYEIMQAPLPVTLDSYQAFINEDHAIVAQWQVASEINCSHYDIEILNTNNAILSKERVDISSDKDGQYCVLIPYQGNDKKLYVNLIQYDFDGKRSHLGTKVINLKNPQQDIKFYPNPTNGIIILENTSDVSILKTEIVDINGKQILTKEGEIDQIDLSMLAKGLYLVRCFTTSGVVVQKVIKE